MGFITNFSVKARFPATMKIINMKLTKEEKEDFIKILPVIEKRGLCEWRMHLNDISGGYVGYTNSTNKTCGMSYSSKNDYSDKYAQHDISVGWYGYTESFTKQQILDITDGLIGLFVQKILSICPDVSIVYDDLSQLSSDNTVVVFDYNSFGVMQ
jgi:hypothetical protein